MHEDTPEKLRKQALKNGGKTVSKKALSKQASLSGSRIGSRATSKANSRVPSVADSQSPERSTRAEEDEDSEFSRSQSPSAWEAVLEGENESPEFSLDTLTSVIDTIQDRDWKRGNTTSRQQTLITYIRILCRNFVTEDIPRYANQLVSAFVKIIKADDDADEVNLVLRAIAVTVVTHVDEDLYELATPAIKRAITDSSDIKTKSQAIQTLSILAFYSDLSEDALGEMLDFFLEIVSTDGGYIDALDEGRPVAAALEAWGFLATLVEDGGYLDTDTAFETFIEQLDSNSAAVLIAAGENIALLYEKAYQPLSEDDTIDITGPDVLTVKNGGTKYYKRLYDLYPRPNVLEAKLDKLQKHSSRRVSKADRKSLHSSFKDILHSVQNPTLGPHYSTALDEETGTAKGSRLKVKSGTNGLVATIDKWWMLHRHRVLKEIIGSGFMIHYEENPAIFEALPIVFVSVGKTSKGRKSARDWAVEEYNTDVVTRG